MLLSEHNIKQFAGFYLICFLLWYAWFAYNGLLFSKIEPVFFLNKLDISHNFFMLTNLQHALLENKFLRFFFDLVYLILPVLLVYSCFKNKKIQPVLAITTAFYNVLYNGFFSIISYISIEVASAWMIVPMIFYARSTAGFFFLLQIVRLLFIIMFFSSALWKIRSEGVFNLDEMSAILFKQHASLLAVNMTWYGEFIIFLIMHQALSYKL